MTSRRGKLGAEITAVLPCRSTTPSYTPGPRRSAVCLRAAVFCVLLASTTAGRTRDPTISIAGDPVAQATKEVQSRRALLAITYSVDQCSLGNLTVSKDFRCYSVNARAACCYVDGTCAANDIENDTNTCTEGLPACCRADGGYSEGSPPPSPSASDSPGPSTSIIVYRRDECALGTQNDNAGFSCGTAVPACCNNTSCSANGDFSGSTCTKGRAACCPASSSDAPAPQVLPPSQSAPAPELPASPSSSPLLPTLSTSTPKPAPATSSPPDTAPQPDKFGGGSGGNAPAPGPRSTTAPPPHVPSGSFTLDPPSPAAADPSTPPPPPSPPSADPSPIPSPGTTITSVNSTPAPTSAAHPVSQNFAIWVLMAGGLLVGLLVNQ